ncbi:MAG: protein-L-isoaspartate O-methyltransferase [Alphaproteobacteria bacterium]|nr:protein-L-isoaspartate O-methyltransferase [Alphaproteobacteria bacterium]
MMVDFATQRMNMVEGQLRPSRVIDPRVLAAAGEVRRELFAPEPLRGAAYVDEDLPLGGGRFLIEPLILARLIQAGEVNAGDNALVVACATGYGAALMARLAKKVVAVEGDSRLAATARGTLKAVGAANVEVVVGPPHQGWPSAAPFQVILIEGAVHDVPTALIEQLAEGGRLVGVVRRDRSGTAIVMRKIRGIAAATDLFDAACPVLPGFAPKAQFVF